MFFRWPALVIVLAACIASPAFAHSVTIGSLSLSDLWTRATPPGAPTAAGYLTITNAGRQADRLVAAASPRAGHGGLHQTETKDGVMSMHPVDDIEIPAGASVTLGPGGLHIMFVTLDGSLTEGDQLPVTLTFEKAGAVDAFLHVLAIGAKGPAMDSMNPGNGAGGTK